MKKIVGFWAGSEAYETAIKQKEVVEFVRRKWGMLSVPQV